MAYLARSYSEPGIRNRENFLTARVKTFMSTIRPFQKKFFHKKRGPVGPLILVDYGLDHPRAVITEVETVVKAIPIADGLLAEEPVIPVMVRKFESLPKLSLPVELTKE